MSDVSEDRIDWDALASQVGEMAEADPAIRAALECRDWHEFAWPAASNLTRRMGKDRDDPSTGFRVYLDDSAVCVLRT